MVIVLFAHWSGRGDELTPQTPRSFEVGLMVPGSATAVNDIYAAWTAKGFAVIEEPHDEVFGRTFVIADPDGNLVRVSPVE